MHAIPELPAPIHITINADRLGAAPLHVNFHADTAACKALAAYLKVDAVENFQVELAVTRWRKHGARIQGSVSADIEQPCVVTLAPVRTHVCEPVEARFLPASMLVREANIGPEIIIDPMADDPPEPFEGREINFGPLLLEHLALGIDAYPRAPGAELPVNLTQPDTENEKRANPFQVLAQLRKKPGE
jgi:uncharacterized metal-binding protein YceD (DUF177 family)